MLTCCLALLLALVGQTTAASLGGQLAQVDAEIEDAELILVANADLEKLHPSQVIEGDIVLDGYTRHVIGLADEDASVADQLLPDEKRKKKAGMSEEDRHWPGGVVPYAYAPFIGEDAVKVINVAIKHWMANTCIKFKLRTNEKDYIRFVREYGCWSWVGRIGGEQAVSVGDHTPSNKYCLSKGTISHEIGHALGFWHEQARPDRDQFVDIMWDNIREGSEINFHKYSQNEVDSLGVEYDYGSIMHYGKRAFSKNHLPTIVPKQKVKIGQRNRLSDLDIKQANLMYKCAEKMHLLRPALSNKPEPAMLIQNAHGGVCIEAQPNTTAENMLLLNTCNQNNSLQQWKWNKENQLYNPITMNCICTGPKGLMEQCSCVSGDPLQQFLCANFFIEHPTTGNCMTLSEYPHPVVAEKCTIENRKQLWYKYDVDLDMELSLLHLLSDINTTNTTAEPICTVPDYHTVVPCYSEKVRLGWSYCQRLGYVVAGLYHIGVFFLITDLRCCFISHVFTGQQQTAASTEQEICTVERWWSLNEKGWFKCPTGLYLKGYLKDSTIGLDGIKLVRCCRAADAPPIYRQCYTDSTDGSEGMHQCARTGYHIAGVYKAVCSRIECIERLYCCI